MREATSPGKVFLHAAAIGLIGFLYAALMLWDGHGLLHGLRHYTVPLTRLPVRYTVASQIAVVTGGAVSLAILVAVVGGNRTVTRVCLPALIAIGGLVTIDVIATTGGRKANEIAVFARRTTLSTRVLRITATGQIDWRHPVYLAAVNPHHLAGDLPAVRVDWAAYALVRKAGHPTGNGPAYCVRLAVETAGDNERLLVPAHDIGPGEFIA